MTESELDERIHSPFWSDLRKSHDLGNMKFVHTPEICQNDTAYHIGHPFMDWFYISTQTYGEITAAFGACDQERIKKILSRIIVIRCVSLREYLTDEEIDCRVRRIQKEKAKSEA